jgi:hypothetical protein
LYAFSVRFVHLAHLVSHVLFQAQAPTIVHKSIIHVGIEAATFGAIVQADRNVCHRAFNHADNSGFFSLNFCILSSIANNTSSFVFILFKVR